MDNKFILYKQNNKSKLNMKNHYSLKKNLTLNFFILFFCFIQSNIFSQTYNYTTYNNTNSGIGFNSVSDIEIDNNGSLWLSSWYNNGGSGISKFDGTSWTNYNTNNQQGTNSIHKIEFSTGTLQGWVSVFATTIVNFANGTQTTINSNHNYSTNILTIEIPINAINFQIDYYIEDPSVSVNMNFYNLSNNNIIHQEIFSGTMNKEYDYVFFTNIGTNQVTDISIDNLNNKWIASSQNGLSKFDNYNWTNFNTSNSSIPSNSINCIATDANNNVWIATNQGLTKFNGTTWITYNTSNSSLTTNQINSVAIDNSNVLWLTTGSPFSNSQLISFTNNIWTIYNYSGGIGRILKIDNNNTIYTNSYWGFSKFENLNWTHYRFDYTNSPTCLLSCQVEAIEKNLNGDIFAGLFSECTSGGLQNFSSCTSFNSFLPPNFENITEIKRDNNNNIWVGSLNGGLLKMTPNNLGLEEVSSVKKLLIYPNPTKNTFTIKNIENDFSNFEYKIIDLTGRIIKNGKSKFNEQINIENLTSGNYIIQIETEDRKIATEKLIKN